MEKDVPYIVYESEAASHERTVKRLIRVVALIVLLLVVTNMAWLYVFNQYDISSEEYVIEGTDSSNANMLGAGASVNGVINNGKDTSEKENHD